MVRNRAFPIRLTVLKINKKFCHTWPRKTLLSVHHYFYSRLSVKKIVWKEKEKEGELSECPFHPSPVCFALQPRLPGRERCAEWERAATHVKPHCLTFTGSAKNVDLWCVWTVTKPRRGRAPKVSRHFYIHLWTLTVLVHSCCWYAEGLKTLSGLEKCPDISNLGAKKVSVVNSTGLFVYLFILTCSNL